MPSAKFVPRAFLGLTNFQARYIIILKEVCEEITMKKLHLICNAHIDPIWQWTWDEGISSAIATFRSAADLADEFDYIFCHNEALLYEAIEQNAPDLFARIQRLVKEGKWHIMGGWYLQPDCLMPAGETIVRQIAVGREYFKEKFDTAPEITVNMDSFGHSVGLVQILSKMGYRGYMTCRPRSGDQFKFPSRFFTWRGPDGSSLIATQSASYNSLLGHAAEKIESYVSGAMQGMLGSEASGSAPNETDDIDYVLWGVGNHGGGPSRKDLSDIAALKIDGVEIKHSTPEALFADGIRVGGEVTTSLVTCMPGCYSSMARVKQAFRRTENLFYATEKMITAARLCGYNPDLSKFKEAEKRILLSSFHDILPGTVVEEAEKEALSTLGSAERALRDYRTNAFLFFTMNESSAGEGEYPVFVFNYSPKVVSTTVEVEFSLADQNWSEEHHFSPVIYDESGTRLPSQTIKEASTLNLDWRKRIIFEADLKPLGITRFTVKVEPVPIREKEAVDVNDVNAILDGVSLISTAAEFELYDDTADPWGMSNDELVAMGKNPGPFRPMTKREGGELCATRPMSPFRIIEDGEIYTNLEAFYTASNTNAVLNYKLYKNKPYVDLKLTVEFADKNKLVRIKIPVPSELSLAEAVGDGPYVWEKKPSTEIAFQKWVGVKSGGDDVFAVINDGVYAGKVENGYIYLTLLRGAGHCFHPIYDRELYPQYHYLPRIDSGRYVYNLRIFRGTLSEVFDEAERFNQPPYAVNVFPTGASVGSIPDKRISIDGEIVTSVVKPRADGSVVMRFYNPSERESKFTVRYDNKSLTVTASAHEIVSVIYDGELTAFHGEIPY